MSDLDTPVTTSKGTFRVRLEQDQDPMSPRSYDNAGVVVAVNNEYEVPQEGENVPQLIDWIEADEDFPQIAQWLRAAGATVVLPLYDRGRGELQVGDADDTYTDGPLLGVMYDNAKDTRENLALDSTYNPESNMCVEIGEYNKWAEGDVWGYVIERQIPACTHCGCPQRWDVEDSVWGHIGYEYALQSAREADCEECAATV